MQETEDPDMNQRHTRTGSTTTQRGFSLVELMIAMLIGLLVTAAVIALVVNSSRTHNELTKTSRQIENARYATQLLSDEVRHAGYFGRFFAVPGPTGAGLPDPCDNSGGMVDLRNALEAGLALHIQAHTNPGDLSCLPAANHRIGADGNGTDIIVVRRVASMFTRDTADLEPDLFYMQTQPTQMRLDQGSNTTTFDLTEIGGVPPAPIHRLHTDIYYLAPCPLLDNPQGTCNNASPDLPTLMRLRLGPNGQWINEPLVEGIEDMRVEFGIDNTGDGVPNNYEQMPATLAQWVDVISVRLHLLARTTEATPAHTDEKQYNLGGVVLGPMNDQLRRRVFSTTIRLHNPAGRREE